MQFLAAFFRMTVGVLFGFASSFAISPAIAAFSSVESSNTGPLLVLSIAFVGGMLGLFAPTMRRAFGRGFLLLGAAVFLLPLSTMLLSGRAASEVIGAVEEADQGFAAIGAGAAGVLVTGIASFVGFFLGAVLLVIGLVLALGGRREVTLVEQAAKHKLTRE